LSRPSALGNFLSRPSEWGNGEMHGNHGNWLVTGNQVPIPLHASRRAWWVLRYELWGTRRLSHVPLECLIRKDR